MARTRSISSIDSEIQKIEAELIKVRNKQESLESTLLELQTQTSHISFSYAPGKFNTWQLFNCQCSVNYAACNFDFKSAGIASINASTSSSIFSSDISI